MALACKWDGCMGFAWATHPTETRMDAGFAGSVKGLDTSEAPYTRDLSVHTLKRKVGESTQAGGRDCLNNITATCFLNYPNSSHRSESKQPCGFRWDGLVLEVINTHPTRGGHGLDA